MDAIRNGLDSLPSASGAARRAHRTKAVKAKLCEIGSRAPFNCRVRATLPTRHGEWLYDVVWLKRHEGLDDHPISCVPLVAECEWGTYAHIKEDFQKLLLARASARLMIYRDPMFHRHHGWKEARWTAEQLALHVNHFNRSYAEDAWLLAAWRRTEYNLGFAFTYFTINPSDGSVTEL